MAEAIKMGGGTPKFINAMLDEFYAETNDIKANTFVEFVSNYSISDTFDSGNLYADSLLFSSSCIEIDNNRVILFYNSSSQKYAQVINVSTHQLGTPLLLQNFNGSTIMNILYKLSENVYVVGDCGYDEYGAPNRMSSGVNTYPYLCTISVSNLTITISNSFSIAASTRPSTSYAIGPYWVLPLNSSGSLMLSFYYLSALRSNPKRYEVALLQLSETSITTLQSEVLFSNLSGTSDNTEYFDCKPLDDNNFIVTFLDGTTSSTDLTITSLVVTVNNLNTNPTLSISNKTTTSTGLSSSYYILSNFTKLVKGYEFNGKYRYAIPIRTSVLENSSLTGYAFSFYLLEAYKSGDVYVTNHLGFATSTIDMTTSENYSLDLWCQVGNTSQDFKQYIFGATNIFFTLNFTDNATDFISLSPALRLISTAATASTYRASYVSYSMYKNKENISHPPMLITLTDAATNRYYLNNIAYKIHIITAQEGVISYANNSIVNCGKDITNALERDDIYNTYSSIVYYYFTSNTTCSILVYLDFATQYGVYVRALFCFNLYILEDSTTVYSSGTQLIDANSPSSLGSYSYYTPLFIHNEKLYLKGGESSVKAMIGLSEYKPTVRKLNDANYILGVTKTSCKKTKKGKVWIPITE